MGSCSSTGIKFLLCKMIGSWDLLYNAMPKFTKLYCIFHFLRGWVLCCLLTMLKANEKQRKKPKTCI